MALSHSARQEFLTCQRKYYLSRVLRLELDTNKASLRMGAAYARCLEHAKADAADEDYDEALGVAKSQKEVDSLRLEQAQIKVLVPRYLRKYGEPTALVKREHPFTHPMLGEGGLDALTYIPAFAKFDGIEDKLLTKGFWREANERQLAIDAQTTAYFAAVRDQGMQMRMMQRRITFKPGIKPDSRKGESLADYVGRLNERLDKEPEYCFAPPYDLYRTNEEMDAFLRRVDMIAHQVSLSKRMEKKLGEDAWPGNFDSSCTLYGECAFLSLCADNDKTKYRKKAVRPKLNQNQWSVLFALSQALTIDSWTPDIAAQAGLPDPATRSALEGLVKKGLAAKGRVGRSVVWHVTDTGKKLARS